MGRSLHTSILTVFVVAAVWLAAWTSGLLAQEPQYDILIHGGRIVNGTGNPWFSGDVGITGDRIAAVGRPGQCRGYAGDRRNGHGCSTRLH